MNYCLALKLVLLCVRVGAGVLQSSLPIHITLILCFPLRRHLGSDISKGCIFWFELFIRVCPKIGGFRDQNLFWKCADIFYVWVKLPVFMTISDYSMILFASTGGSIILYADLYTWKMSPNHFTYHFSFFIIFVEVHCKELFPPEPSNIVIIK